MKVNRKEFLFTVVAGAAVTAVHPLSAITIGTGSTPVARSFGGFVGRTFRVQSADGRSSIPVILEAYDERPPSNRTHQFTLTFVAPGGESLAEGTYTVEQAQMGRFPLFVVPTRRDGQGRAYYRADFNLLLRK